MEGKECRVQSAEFREREINHKRHKKPKGGSAQGRESGISNLELGEKERDQDQDHDYGAASVLSFLLSLNSELCTLNSSPPVWVR